MQRAEPCAVDTLEDLVASPGDWNQVGYGGNPVAGNPRVLDGFTRDFRLLRDLAADVDAGLDNMLRTASDGGFEGKTADALRTYVKQSLKKFMANARSAFDLAASATARYANALRDAQGRAERAAERGGAVAIPPAGLVGKNAPPPAELTAAKNDVEAEVDFITGEAKILEDALRTAADMVSSPIAPLKKSFKQRLVEGLWKALEIVTIVVSIAAMIVGGPLGLLAFGMGAVLFFKALVDYRQGKLNGVGLGLAFLGILFPSTKGLTTAAGLVRMLKAGASIGAKGAGRALSAGGRLVMQAGRLVMAPRTMAALTGQGLWKLFQGGGRMFATGMSRLPGLLAGTPRALMGAMRMAGGFARGMMRSARFTLRRDFFMATAFIGGGMGGRLGVYALTNVGRAFDFAVAALLPLRYAELTKYGFRAAFRMGILERGLLGKPSIGGALGRTAGSVGDLAARTGRGLSAPDAARPFGERGKLVVPGTSAWDDALDELTEFMPPPTALSLAMGASSLSRVPGIPSGRFASAVDDLVEPAAFRDLDALGSRFGPLLRNGGIDVSDLGAGGLLPPQFRNALDALDDLDKLAGIGTAVRSPLLEQPQSAVARLRDLDTFTGMDRTGTGLLKPMDELADLAPFSIDGKLGGLTTVQVRKILDGEIDVVDVVPDGVILRIGKTDPVNVHVGLKGEVTVRVLDPDEVGTGPLAGKFTGADSPAGLGFQLDELARLLPDRSGELGRARELLGLGPAKTDLAAKPVSAQPGFPPLTLREIITGGAVGKTGAERFQAWVRAQNAAVDLDTAGQKLAQVADLPHVSPLYRAEAELDLSAAELKFNHARLDFDRLGMNLDTVRQNITVMMVRLDGPGAHLPVGELRLLDDLAQPTGRWITMEPGEQLKYVLRTDAGIVPDVKVAMVDGHFTVTGTDGIVTRFGPDGAPLRVDVPVRPEAPAGPSTVHGADPVQVDVPVVPQVHWLVRQDMDFATSSLKSGMKTHLTTEGLVPVKIDGTITPLQAVTTANAKAFKAESPFTAFSPPGSIVKSYGNQEIGLDLIALRNDINAGVENLRNIEILSTTKVQDAILDEIRIKTGVPDLELPSTFTHTTGNKEIQEFLARNGVTKGMATKVTPDIKTLLQVRRDNTWLIKGTIPSNYLKGPYPTVDSLKHIPAAPTPLESAGRASGSGLPPVEVRKPVPKSDDFYMSNVDLEDLRGVKLVRQDDFHMVQQDLKGLRKSYFDPDVGMIPANPEGRTTAFQHVAGAENAARKSNSPFTSFAEIGNHKVYGDVEFTLDAYKLGVDIKAGRLPDVGILPAKDLQRLIGDQIERAIGKRLDFTSALSGNSSRQDVLNFLKSHDVNPAKSNKFVADVRVLLNTTRDQEWLIKGTIPKSYLEGPYPRTAAPSGIGDALSAGPLRGLDEAAGHLRLSDTFKADFEAKPALVEWHTPAGTNSGSWPLELRIGELRLTDQLGRPNGQWITLEPGENLNWVVKTDAGIVVPGARVDALDDGFRVTTPDGLTTRFGPDGRPVLADTLPVLNRFDAPQPMSELRFMDPGQTGVRVEWQSAPRPGGGVTLTDALGDVRLHHTADHALEFVDMRVPGRDAFLRFDAAPEMGSLPRVIGPDGLPLAGTGVVVDPVRGALGVVTGVKVGTPDGAWAARFDLDGTRLSEELRLSGQAGGALTDARLVTTVTRGPGGEMAPTLRLAAPGLGDGAFSVVRLPGGEAAGRLPAGGFAVTDLASGDRFVFDRAGRFVDLPADAPPMRLDAAGTTLPDPNVGPVTALDDFGGPLSERFPLDSIPEHNPLDGAATDLPRIELPGADAAAVARAADVALPADLTLTRLTEFQDVPLSGAGDLAGLEFRIVGGTAADGVPGTFRLDVSRATPTPHGAGPQPRFTVERLDNGTFRVTDPAGTTRWEFGARGEFVARETALVDHDLGLPSGLWFRNTATTTTDGITSRIVGLVGPREVTDSFPLTTIDRTLQDRLPGGFTLTDSVTGSRFHYDADLNLAFRDLPAHDGSGFLRHTEGASDIPPVRLDDLGGPSGLDDLTQIFERTLDEASGGTRPFTDVTDLSLGAAPHLPGLDDAAALRLSDAVGEHGDQWFTRLNPGDAPDLDLRAAWRTLDEHWTGYLEGMPGIRLSGADDLADLEIRVVRVPSTDTAPGSFRLGLLDRAPAADGTVRGADFTVERIPGGRFTITDPTGNTTWAFAQDGSFLGREAVLTGEGLPSGLRVSATHNEAGGFTQVDLLGPESSVRSLQVTPPEGALAGRLPRGFTLTDTVTGSRFHFDRTGALVYRDLPARDGSGFLRFTEGAHGAQPTRLVDPLSERFPLSSIPEEDVLDEGLTDVSELFQRTLDEASGTRVALPEDAAAVDLSSISGAMEFLHGAPDSHAIQNLDLLRVQQLAGDATDSLNRFPGLRPELLHDQFRQMTAQAHEGIRQGAATVMREYQNLPLATRLEDLQSGGSRVFGDFTVTHTPHGGPGGSRFTVTHTPTDLTTGFGPNRELLYREVFVRGGPAELDGTKLGLTGRAAGGGWAPDSFQFVGTHVADDAFTLTRLDPNLPADLRGGFTLTDAAGTTKWHFGPEGTLALRDVQLADGRGMFRFEAGAPNGVPQVLDASGRPALTLRAERLDDGRIALSSTGKGGLPLERTMFDAQGTKLLEETVAVRIKGGTPNGEYWRIDHVTGDAVRLDRSGDPLTGRYATAKVGTSGTGRLKLTGSGNVTLFEREILGSGNVLHIDMDRVGRARWTEFDKAGAKVRSGERIWDSDRRTIHDTMSYRWAPVDVLDVRTYTKSLDGGLIRAEKNAAGDWTWTRFDSSGTEVLSGTREWSWNHIGFKDTYHDPVTGQQAVAQQRGNIWPLEGYHGSRQYLEHPVLSGHAPAGTRVDPDIHTAVGPNNKPIDFIERLADGGTLHVARLTDQRVPAAFWKARTGADPLDGFFRDLATGNSMFQVSKWTETAADGTRLTGVRQVAHGGHSWQDVDQFGRVVRETRKLEDGSVIEVGRSLTDAKQWAPAPKWEGSATAYELPWLNKTSGLSGVRHVAADGSFEDVFRGAADEELLALRSQGTGVREYLAENPARGIGSDDVTGVWVDKNAQHQITGRRDLWDDLHVEASGDPRTTDWTWKATDSQGNVTEGMRKQNRGSLHSPTWDDSFIDFQRLDNGLLDAVRERTATDTGTVWINATKGDDIWTWQKTSADGTVHSQGVRDYQDITKGRWQDRIGDEVVRERSGGRVREYSYTVDTPPRPVAAELTRLPTLAEVLSMSRQHFQPPVSVTVDRQVWKEWDMGRVVHSRDPVKDVPGRYRESEALWEQWREYQDGRLVAQRTITGRVWATDAFGRWSAFDIAKLPEISSLPRVGGNVGLDEHSVWWLIGREADFRGYTNELRGLNREFRDPFHEIWTGVRDGSSQAMPMWRHQLRKAALDFAVGYVMEFGTSLAVSAITAELGNTRFDLPTALQRAALNGAIGGGIRTGVNVLYDTTRLGYLKHGLTNLDQGQNFHRHPAASNDNWAGEWSAYENPSRVRSGTYDYFNGLAVSTLTGFVNNAVNAAVFGVGGQQRTGLDALKAGAWGAAGSAFTGVTSGALRYAWHTTAGSRVFHRGGPGDYLWQASESVAAGIINFYLTGRDGANINSGRAFPKPVTIPSAPPPPPAPQPPADQPDAPIQGLELP